MKLSKKLIGSLAIVAVTAALAVGGTISYFSDTETSEGNTFTAGAVDLTVDSVGHYNGLICVGNKWQSCEAPNLETNLVDNGSFETPLVTATQNWQIFNSGTGWDIDWANDSQLVYQGRNRPEPALQEYHSGVLGDAKHGDQYTELDSDWFGPNDSLNGEPALIKISQDINTVAGMQYQLSYWFSPRPDTAAGNNEMKVYVNGDLVGTNGGAGGASIVWTQFTYIFTAEGGTTKIEFVGGGTDDSLGIFLDDVRVHEMLCEESEEYTEACYSTWGLTDLGATNQFFNFGDIKPGDEGENTISLHVNSNDAYGCMVFSGLVDDENSINEPESEVDQTATGELSKNIYMYAWADDGDNIFDENEVPFFEGLLANDVDGTIIPLTTIGNPIAGGETRYVGLSWCAGTMGFDEENRVFTCDGESMGNDTQTDKMLFDVSFYVEQARHNEEFTCDVLRTDQETVVTDLE
ncbi:hypothetical protein A2619_05665 [candidate division WWE3 bacterium RIFOXYD1_FULL_39_9]|uniref:SipW-cognate class signal peptide n=1 Tax=candidate division WWE3 bacterium RIFOXYD1_FULL_39_9 TaxID=1802649 RepID=A0A1F4X9R5_UNCKA|nr:MAG: hypothetical protein A2619_05665 [candidate division WWE3 bacterium RIFOXYD1_FULL_39_9]